MMYGALSVISADNLGSLALGGFKESCSAYRLCRHCMATHESSQTKVITYVVKIIIATTAVCIVYNTVFGRSIHSTR